MRVAVHSVLGGVSWGEGVSMLVGITFYQCSTQV